MKVIGTVLAEIRGGYFYDDQAAIRAGASADGQRIIGTPVTDGFAAVRVPATGIAIGLQLDDGFVAWGDAVSVQYPGVADRDPPLLAERYLPALTERLAPAMVGLELGSFRAANETTTRILRDRSLDHAAIAYGLSQALLVAASRSHRCSMAEVISKEFDLPLRPHPVPVFAQSGDDRHQSADKMIMKAVEVLPHGLINSVEKLGPSGERLIDYVEWLRRRIHELAPTAGYSPTLHFDLYGTPGEAFGQDPDAICAYLGRLVTAASPYRLQIETPVIAASRAEQIAALAAIRRRLAEDRVALTLVADEWCNTLDDIRAFLAGSACDMVQIKMPDLGSIVNSIVAVGECRRANVKAYLGGSCAETDWSARISAHVAVATQADMQLAKPGMGVDEALMIVGNEQTRLLAELQARLSPSS